MSRKDLLPDAGPVLTVRQALYRASRDYRGGQGALALDMGVDAGDLCKRLNPVDSRSVSPEWLEEIVGFTRDPRLLDALVRPAGAVWYRVEPVSATRDALRALSKVCGKEAEFIASLAAGASDGVWELHEVQELEHHGHALIRKLLGIMAGAREAMEQGGEGVQP